MEGERNDIKCHHWGDDFISSRMFTLSFLLDLVQVWRSGSSARHPWNCAVFAVLLKILWEKRRLIFKMWIDIFRCQSHTFQGFSLQLAAGESVPWATSAVIPDIPVFVCPRTCALVGASGCGKSAAEQYLFAWSCFGGFGWWHVHVFQRKLHELPEPQPFGCCWATSKWLLAMFA